MKLAFGTMAWKDRWQRFWSRFGEKLVLGSAFLLVGIFSFEAGLLQKSLGQPAPVLVRVVDAVQNPAQGVPGVGEATTLPAGKKVSEPTAVATEPIPDNHCQFVGSKKSNKYHHPASRCAKQIKAENKRCFLSAEDAAAKGYLPGCLEP